jgi:hypothetical protein
MHWESEAFQVCAWYEMNIHKVVMCLANVIGYDLGNNKCLLNYEFNMRFGRSCL